MTNVCRIVGFAFLLFALPVAWAETPDEKPSVSRLVECADQYDVKGRWVISLLEDQSNSASTAEIRGKIVDWLDLLAKTKVLRIREYALWGASIKPYQTRYLIIESRVEDAIADLKRPFLIMIGAPAATEEQRKLFQGYLDRHVSIKVEELKRIEKEETAAFFSELLRQIKELKHGKASVKCDSLFRGGISVSN